MSTTSEAEYRPDFWRLALPGFCASFVTIGLARFAYTPLLPVLVSDHWFGAHEAAYLAAANLSGYLFGVIGTEVFARAASNKWFLRTSTLVAALSLLACAWPGEFVWFFSWRFLSGVAGGIVMVLASSSIIPHIAPHRRGVVSGIIFMGIGCGVIVSGTLVPLLLSQNLVTTWLGLGIVAAIFACAGWFGWQPTTQERRLATPRRRYQPTVLVYGLYAIYGLVALALVPHMIFFVDFVARGLGQGLAAGTQYWVLYGIGATAGPVLAGHGIDRWGARRTLLFALGLQLVFTILPAIFNSPLALISSSVAIGACTIGVVPLALGRVREILLHHSSAHFAAWRSATACFAVCQAIGAYSMPLLFEWSGGSYRLLFVLASSAIALAIAVCVLTQQRASADE